MKNQKNKTKRILKIALSVISIVVLVFALTVFGIVIAARVKGESPSLFGYHFHIVVTDSMTPEIKVGDLVIAKSVDNADIGVGDDIVFVTEDPELNGKTIVHRVIAINADGSFTTQGIKENAKVDDYPVHTVIGKVQKVSSSLGGVTQGMYKYRNYIFGGALLLLVVIIASEIISMAKNVQKDKIEAQKKQELDAEIKVIEDIIKEKEGKK